MFATKCLALKRKRVTSTFPLQEHSKLSASVVGGGRHFRELLLILRYFKHAEIDMHYCGEDIIFIIILGES